MFQRFTNEARDVVTRASSEAQDGATSHIGTEHLLLALLLPDAGAAYAILREAGLDARQVRTQLQRPTTTTEAVVEYDDAAALKSLGIDLPAVLARIEETFGKDALASARSTPRRGLRRTRRRGTSLSPQSKKVLELSLREAVRLHHHEIRTEHLLLGLLSAGDGRAITILADAGLDLDDLRARVLAGLDKAA